MLHFILSLGCTFVKIFNNKIMKKTIVKIDENLCTGCGSCVKGCHGGALQIIDGKARIINEDYCDGLGACLGECPVGAITLEEREINPSNNQTVTERVESTQEKHCVCPSMQEQAFNVPSEQNSSNFEWHQFPIQLRLVNANAAFLKNSDLVLAADCTAFVYANFHKRFMKNSSLVIACPKLDNAAENYIGKLMEMIDNSSINTLTVILMEVPCCGGLLHIARQAQVNASRKIPIKKIIIGIKGNLISEEWI